MKITGETIIAAKPDVVWRGLNDPDILRQAIPGCESLEQTGPDRFKAAVTTRIGPITARFNGAIELTDLDPPNGYTLVGSGSAGAMGAAKGSARVRLMPQAGGTRLTYDVDVDMSGRIAQLGARLIQGTVDVLAGQFFTTFGALVSGVPTAGAPRTGVAAVPLWVWAALAALAAAALAVYLTQS